MGVVCLSRADSKLGRLECVFIVSEEIQLGPQTDDGHPGDGVGGGDGGEVPRFIRIRGERLTTDTPLPMGSG